MDSVSRVGDIVNSIGEDALEHEKRMCDNGPGAYQRELPRPLQSTTWVTKAMEFYSRLPNQMLQSSAGDDESLRLPARIATDTTVQCMGDDSCEDDQSGSDLSYREADGQHHAGSQL